MLGLAEGLVQWVFDRGALTGGSASTRCTLLCETPASFTTSSRLWPARRRT